MMLVGAVLLLQLAAPAPIAVRGPSGQATVPVHELDGSSFVRVDQLAPVMRAFVRPSPDGRFTVVLADLEIELTDRSPFARIRGEVVPLGAAPRLDRGIAHLPVQLLAEIAPRRSALLTYNAALRELQVGGPATVTAAGSVWEGAGEPGGAAPSATSSTSPRPAAGRSAPARAPRPARSGPVASGALPRSAPAPAPASTPASAARRQRTVVIDPGHGGTDPGTSGTTAAGRQVLEKDLALAVALRLRDSLTRRGVRVVMTRDTDTLIALADRGRIANRHNGDLFLSIHVNSSNPRARDRAQVRGVETYFLAEARTEDARRVEQMENEVVRFETAAQPGKDDPLGFILNDMAQNEHLRESSDLASVVQSRLAEIHPGPNRGVKQAGFRVLMTTFMPAVLIEIGFASNGQEATFMSDARRQAEIARAIALATMEYLEHYERRMGGLSP